MTFPQPAWVGNPEWIVGDTNDLLIQVTDPATGLPLPLKDAKVWLVAKRAMADADVDAVVYLTSDPGGGVTITAPEATAPTDPGAGQAIASMPVDALAGLAVPTWLYYAAQVRNADGQVWEVLTGTTYVRRGVVDAQA